MDTTKSPTAAVDLRPWIRDVPDFPKKGILFKDITPLLKDPRAYRGTIDRLAAEARGLRPELIACPEARGFIFGASLAMSLGIGFIPIRKPGKLPYATRSITYDLEYGKDSVHMHVDAVEPGRRVLIVDDVLATGGTMEACASLVEGAGGVVAGCGFVVELGFLEGRKRLGNRPVFSLLTF
jgi:adenine phosphoribosyltransferase